MHVCMYVCICDSLSQKHIYLISPISLFEHIFICMHTYSLTHTSASLFYFCRGENDKCQQ